jgi:hypothetical protein
MDAFSTLTASALVILMTQLSDISVSPAPNDVPELHDPELNVPADSERSGPGGCYYCVVS